MCIVYISLNAHDDNKCNAATIESWKLHITDRVIPIIQEHSSIEWTEPATSYISLDCYDINILMLHIILEENGLYLGDIRKPTYSPRHHDPPKYAVISSLF